AAGTWTTGLLAELGWQPAVKPIRGQIILLSPYFSQERAVGVHRTPPPQPLPTRGEGEDPSPPAPLPQGERGEKALPPQLLLRHILLMGHQYLVPRQDGQILVGSTEEDVGFDK